MQRAREQGCETVFVDPKGLSRKKFDQKLADIIKNQHIDLIVLVGYMRILSPEFVQQFPKQIINVHPSLIPKYCGKDFYGQSVHEAVLASKEHETGMTIHYLDEGVDTGEIILQKSCTISPEDTPETLKEKVQALEKKHYPQVIKELAGKA